MIYTCPYCGSKNVDADFVDIGVGFQRFGPYGCEDCYAFEMRGDDPAATDEERRVGWYRGHYTPSETTPNPKEKSP